MDKPNIRAIADKVKDNLEETWQWMEEEGITKDRVIWEMMAKSTMLRVKELKKTQKKKKEK